MQLLPSFFERLAFDKDLVSLRGRQPYHPSSDFLFENLPPLGQQRMGHLLIEVLGIEQQPIHIERYGLNFYGLFASCRVVDRFVSRGFFALQNLSIPFANLFDHRLGF